MKREELLAQARKHMWAAWQLSSEELASQAAATLDGLGMLVPEGGAAELERLRRERDEFCDRVDTLTAVAKGNKRHVQEMFAELQKTQRERDEAQKRVAELEVELRIGAPWTCPTCSKENRRDVCVICETDRPNAEEDCDHPNGYGPNGCTGCGAFRPADDEPGMRHAVRTEDAAPAAEDGCPRNVIDGDVGAHLFRKGALSDSPIACSYCGVKMPEPDAITRRIAPTQALREPEPQPDPS